MAGVSSGPVPEELVRLAEVRNRKEAFEALHVLQANGIERINIWPVGSGPWWLPRYLGPYTIMLHEDDLREARRLVREMGLGGTLCE